jgi:hypothetical protein
VNSQEQLQELFNRSRLPDPCTLVFGVPREAPPPVDDDGRSWSTDHWIHNARRHGHSANRVDSRTAAGTATWCGDIDIDGLIYQVHRGPRKRVLALYVQDGAEAGRFELRESAWVEPVPPRQLPNTCPWCALGPPRTLRHVAQYTTGNGVSLIAASENSDGSGRAVTIQTGLDQIEPYCITLEPAHGTHDGGITTTRSRAANYAFGWLSPRPTCYASSPTLRSSSLWRTSSSPPSAPVYDERCRPVQGRISRRRIRRPMKSATSKGNAMANPYDTSSTISRLQSFAWSSEESVAYEAAIEAINAVVGAYSARIAAEEAKASPGAEVIATAEAGQAECARIREGLDPGDHQQIADARQRFAQLAVEIREGSS